MNDITKQQSRWFLLVAFVTATFSIFSAVLMTEPGQSLNLPRQWVVAYYQYRWLFIAVNLGLLGYLWYLHQKFNIWSKVKMILASTGVLTCIIAANFLLALFFPSYQYSANYVPVSQADKVLQDDEIVYAVEINGEVRGYPREHLVIPHIAGDTIGGKDVVMTFCALSNLPVVIEQDIGHGQSDLGILIQTHNNLVMVDRRSGELVQQINMQSEFDETHINVHPNTMMTWENFKDIYPQGEVFIYEFERAVDSFLLTIFDKPMQRQFSEDHGPMFPTLDMSDDRVGFKEQVWGLDMGQEQIAFTREFAQQNPRFEFEMNEQPMIMVYDEQRDILNVFSLQKEGQTVSVESVDIRGYSDQGRLEQVPLHNGVFWMIWSHWYPQTQLNG